MGILNLFRRRPPFRIGLFARRPGFTIIEMAIAFIILLAIMVATYEVIVYSHISNATLSAWNGMTEWGQTIVNNINLELSQGRVIYQNDTLGNSYLADLEMDPDLPAIGSRRLPVIDANAALGPETTVSRTGNSLLFVQELAPFVGDANGVNRRVDVYQLVYYYLSKTDQYIGTKNESLRVIKWVSVPFADWSQVNSIPAGNARTVFVSNLFEDPREIRYLWVPRNEPNSAFYEITSAGGIFADNSYVIERKDAQSVIGYLGAGYASVAWNSGASFDIPDNVPKYTQANPLGDGFPNGLEIQVVGPSIARVVMVRLVLAYYVVLNKCLYSNESTTIITFHDL